MIFLNTILTKRRGNIVFLAVRKMIGCSSSLKIKPLHIQTNSVGGLDENCNHYFEIGDTIYYPSETNIIRDIVPHDAHEIGMDFIFRPLRRDFRKYKRMQTKY